MAKPKQITTGQIVEGSYGYMRAAVVPALTGTLFYAVTSGVGDYIRSARIFGDYSYPVSITIFSIMAVVWMSMAIRHGLRQAKKGWLGLSLGRDELRLGSSVLGFVAVLSIVAFLLGFAVFLLIMIVAVAGAGALGGDEVADAELFTSPEAFNAFLTESGAGTFVAIAGGGILLAAGMFFVWLVLRLLPFAAATIDQKRFIVLQAAVWTRYQDVALVFGGILTIGVGASFVIVARYGISLLPLPDILLAFLTHVVSCFGALLLIGFICTVYRRLAPSATGPA